jgi:hypothetical protein
MSARFILRWDACRQRQAPATKKARKELGPNEHLTYSVDLNAAKHAGDNSGSFPLRQLTMR